MSLNITNPQALSLWLNTVSTLVRDEETPDLTARQMAILLTVYLTPPPHTVRGLAGRLDITKPVVTRALDTLGRLNLLKRRRDMADKRNVLIERTPFGSTYLGQLSDIIVTAGFDA
ncbi:MAG: MarR family transcriptional regulator [Alphaproteobacteria bacterium]|nr:MarR family transcriptional regulator [Alphaproteobacteria bacterium]